MELRQRLGFPLDAWRGRHRRRPADPTATRRPSVPALVGVTILADLATELGYLNQSRTYDRSPVVEPVIDAGALDSAAPDDLGAAADAGALLAP